MKVTVFGGNTCTKEVHAMAEELGQLLAQAGHTVITGGTDGVASWVSKGAREAGGSAVGIVLKGMSKPNMFVSSAQVMHTYWDRLGALMEQADAYIVLPGGSGTSVELLAALHTQANREKLMPGSPKKLVILLSADQDDQARAFSWLQRVCGIDMAELLMMANTPELAVKHLKAE